MAITAVSFWKQNETWRNRQAELSDQLDVLSALTETMTGTNANLAVERANLAGKAALKRIQAAAAAKTRESAEAAAKAAAAERAMEKVTARLEVPAYIKALAAKVNFTA
jgi:peptidoglycan hydrolase CwlO-like protein